MATAGVNIEMCALCGENRHGDRKLVRKCLEKQMGPYLCPHPGCTGQFTFKARLGRHHRDAHGSVINTLHMKGVNAGKYIHEYLVTVSGNTLNLQEI